MSGPRWDIPNTWAWTIADSISQIIGGGTPTASNPENFTENGIPWITPADLTGYHQKYISRGKRDLTQQGYATSSASLMPAGTVLFSSRAPIGYCVISENEVSTNQGFKSFLPENGVFPEYLYYYLKSSVEYIDTLASGTTFREISGTKAQQISIPLPPTAEQRRIVAKIDALFARSSRAREALAAIPALIDRYRQAVLAAAFRGDLTADWRDGESPMWQEVEACQLFEEGPTNGYSPKAATDGPGTKSLKLSATTTGTFILNDRTTKRLLEDVPPGAKFWLYPGDILIQRANSLEYVGATAIFDGPKQQYIYPDLMMRVRIKSPTTRLFFWRYMNSLSARNWLKERATGTAGNMPKISGSILKKLPVPLPPEDEQAEIILRIEERFAAIDTIARQIRQAANYVTRLDQSILDKAFSGRLVPQDPADEPAAQLLERIRAARAAARNPKRGRRARG